MGNLIDAVIEETIRFIDANGNKVELSASATRRQYAPTATDAEYEQFVDTIEANHLDPRLKEAYFTKYRTKDGKEKVAIVTGYQVYVGRALASGKLAELPEVTIIKPDPKDMNTWYGEISIKRIGMSNVAKWQTPMREVNKGMSLWNVMPEFMLKKNTATQALRFYFADVLRGLPYTAEELSSGMTEEDTNIQPSEEEQQAKQEAQDKYLESLTAELMSIQASAELDKHYKKNAKKYEASELKDIIIGMYASRKYDLVIILISEKTGFSIEQVADYMNPELYRSDIVKEIVAGNDDALKQFASDMSSFINAKESDPEETTEEFEFAMEK